MGLFRGVQGGFKGESKVIEGVGLFKVFQGGIMGGIQGFHGLLRVWVCSGGFKEE